MTKPKKSPSYFSLLVTVSVIILVVLGGQNVFLAIHQYSSSVLGQTTYLARGGDDLGGGGGDSGGGGGSDSGSGNSGSDNSGSGSSGGSDSSGSGSSDDGSGSGSSGSGSSGSSGSGSSIQPTRTEIRTSTGVRTQTEVKPNEERTEARFGEEERIRTRTKDGMTRVDITSGGIKTRLEIKDDRVIVKAEREDGTEAELEDETILKIDDRLAKDNIKIATAEGRFVIQRGATAAATLLPLSIDLATNTLIVTTPAGEKAVTVLPDQAVQGLIAANVVSRLGGQAVVDTVRSGNLTSVSQIINLGEQNGVPVYEINGISDQKLLGFIPVAINKTVTVSAETGQVVSAQEPLGSRILDVLSF